VERVGLLYMADMGEERREIRARPPEATRETDVKRWDDIGVLTPVQSIINGTGMNVASRAIRVCTSTYMYVPSRGMLTGAEDRAGFVQLRS